MLAVLILIAPMLKGQSLMVQDIQLVDVEKGVLKANQDVLIVDGRIQQIGKNLKATKDLFVLDGSGKYLMPGMIDGHIHFFQTGSIYTRPDAMDLRHLHSYEEERKSAFDKVPEQFLRYLRLGITTVVDVGGPFQNFQIRDEVAKENLSPNVLVTGPLFSSVSREKLALDDPPIIIVSTIAAADSLFDKMLPYKPDVIKIWYIVSDELPAEKTYPVMSHVAKRTKENNLLLAVHSTSLATAKIAVELGVDILVHSVHDQLIDDEFVTALKKNKVTYIPTLQVSKNYARAFLSKPTDHPQDLAWGDAMYYNSLRDLLKYDEEDLPERISGIRKNEKLIWQNYGKLDSIMALNLIKLVEAGINVATGTDAGNIGTMHASSYIQELELMAKAGMKAEDLLRASTINAARGYDLADQLGTIEKGKQADLLVLTENPFEELSNLNAIEYVIMEGQLLKADTIIKESPEGIVQRQVNAYNARDIDAFMATYTDDIELYRFPNELFSEGQEQMRARYDKMFNETPDLYCEIKNRTVQGNVVIDQEYVRKNDQFINAIAIYEVNGVKISKVTFIKSNPSK